METTRKLADLYKLTSGVTTLDANLLQLLQAGRSLQMDHYGGMRLPFACLEAIGIKQRLARLEGTKAGAIYDVLDASGGYASACLGAGHAVIQQVLQEAFEDCGYVTDEVGSLERSTLLDNLFGPNGIWVERFPSGEYHVSGRNSGSEGMELALRLALEDRFDWRRLSLKPGREQRKTVLAFEGAWHGWTGGVVPLLNRRHFRIGLPEFVSEGPFGFEVVHLPFADTEILEDFFATKGRTLAAVIVEPVQGDAGIIVPPTGYLRRLSELCREYESLLIADEVLTFAKTGNFFAMSDESGPIRTDITVIGKSLGMGAVSTSMVIARRDLIVRPSGAVSTSDLRPLTCAIIRAGLSYIISQRLDSHARELGEQLRALLRTQVVDAFPEVYREVRGLGLLNGIEVTERASEAVQGLRTSLIENGVYVEFMAGAGRRSRGGRYSFPAMRVAPPLIASSDDIVKIVQSIRAGTEAFLQEGF